MRSWRFGHRDLFNGAARRMIARHPCGTGWRPVPLLPSGPGGVRGLPLRRTRLSAAGRVVSGTAQVSFSAEILEYHSGSDSTASRVRDRSRSLVTRLGFQGDARQAVRIRHDVIAFRVENGFRFPVPDHDLQRVAAASVADQVPSFADVHAPILHHRQQLPACLAARAVQAKKISGVGRARLLSDL
jgi:hypothetical protein